ncbi:hypothetical protein REPUB_Repub12eG0117400 [Reevesia pubescens]
MFNLLRDNLDKLRLLPIKPESASLPLLTPIGVNIDDFCDNDWRDKTAIELLPLNDSQVVELGKVVLPKLQSGISRQGIGALFVLAFNLRCSGPGKTDRVFTEKCPFKNASDIKYSNMDNEKLVATSSKAELTTSGTVEEQAKAYCFLAASVLRLLVRSPGNFCKAWGHIQEGHQTFYAIKCPISRITPRSVVMEAIHRVFS